MNHHYEDIRSRIPEKPMWFDENGTPRYGEFHPKKAANIYADEAVLLRIECQGCGHPFDVCIVSDSMDLVCYRSKLSELAANGLVDYHDPPNIGCCAAGPTMSSISRRVLQFWKRQEMQEWVRVPEFERDQTCEREHDE